MIKITDNDFEIADTIGSGEGIDCVMIKRFKDESEAIKCKQHILDNEKLREQIVDCADIWDGKESSKYGKRLQTILDNIGINDVPDFYSKENIDKIMDELDKERKK